MANDKRGVHGVLSEPLIALIREKSADGMSQRRIAAELENADYLTPAEMAGTRNGGGYDPAVNAYDGATPPDQRKPGAKLTLGDLEKFVRQGEQ